mmetsp:Transcript_66018/g.132982  ORF Transcript_66018/g.132982 Transcript_66018/m.132982 type:complete len:164 (-) Transcript_66018:237-728(-)
MSANPLLSKDEALSWSELSLPQSPSRFLDLLCGEVAGGSRELLLLSCGGSGGGGGGGGGVDGVGDCGSTASAAAVLAQKVTELKALKAKHPHLAVKPPPPPPNKEGPLRVDIEAGRRVVEFALGGASTVPREEEAVKKKKGQQKRGRGLGKKGIGDQLGAEER